MAQENKTAENDAAVEDFLARVEPAERQADGRTIMALMARLSGETPRMWGPSIIGFGRYHYHYDSGRGARAVAWCADPAEGQYRGGGDADHRRIAGAGAQRSGAGSPVAAALRVKGAIILGKTNLSEWANFRSERSMSGWSAAVAARFAPAAALDPAKIAMMRIGVLRGGAQPDLLARYDAALAVLRSLGATLVEVKKSAMDGMSTASYEVLQYEFKAGVNAYLATTRSDHGIPD